MNDDRAQRVYERLQAAMAELGPLRHQPEDFVPPDNIPWEAQAQQLLRCGFEGGFVGLRPPPRVEREVQTLTERLALEPDSSVLVLGCGPGMYSNRLGARGHRVTGIDIAAPVLEHAATQAKRALLPCRYERLSFLEMEFEPQFDAALLTNSIINHLDRAQLDTLLARVFRSLVPGGRFACELLVRTPGFARLQTEEKRRLFDLPFSPWCDRPHLWLERQLTFPAQGHSVMHHIVVPEDGEPREHWSRFDLLPRATLETAFTEAGFGQRVWLDHELSAPTEGDDEQVWVLATRPSANVDPSRGPRS